MQMFGKIACFVVLCMVVVAPHAEAIMSCGQVRSSFAPCFPYLTNRGPLGGCCGGVEGLLDQAQTTVDRQITCTCLKSIASSFTDLDLGKAATLPITCSVNIPFKISPSTDCSKIHWAYAGSSEAS